VFRPIAAPFETQKRTKSGRGRFFHAAMFWLLAMGMLLPPVWAKETTDSPVIAPRKAMAVLVGITNYEGSNLQKLQWCDKDVALVGKTLEQYCACSEIVSMTSGSKQELKPTHDNLVAKLESSLKYADQEAYDRVIIFFAGHGILNEESQGKLYLAPQDFSFDSIHSIEKTGISVAWLRKKLDSYQHIQEKILFLDTCHAGSSRGITSGQKIALGLQKTQKLFTLASCRNNEESLECQDKENGLFTYWLCEGLKGKADKKPYGDENGQVNAKELENFVTEKVAKEAEYRGAWQHPVPVFPEGKSNEPWIPTLAFLPPETNLAERPALINSLLMEANKYKAGGNYAAAIDQIGRALAIDPNHAESFALRGSVHLNRGKSRKQTIDQDSDFYEYRAAVEDFNAAIELGRKCTSPNDLACWYSGRSIAHFQLGPQEYEEALQDASTAIELQQALPLTQRAEVSKGEVSKAYENRAKILRKMGRIEESTRNMEKANESK
jgi:tetratricopeptide (TPR) repeat protein